MERLRGGWDNRVSRRKFLIGAGVTGIGVTAIGGLIQYLASQEAFRDPYKGIHLDEYFKGYVSVDLSKVPLRTAPSLDPQYLRVNNPEGYVNGKIPPGFREVKASVGTSANRHAILGELVEINSVSVTKNEYDPVTERKSILITPIDIQNPGIVGGAAFPNYASGEDRWAVLSTRVRIPVEEMTDYPDKEFYATLRRVFYVSVSARNAEFVKLKDTAGTPFLHPYVASIMNSFYPLVNKADGTHIGAIDRQPVKYLGRVILPSYQVNP